MRMQFTALATRLTDSFCQKLQAFADACKTHDELANVYHYGEATDVEVSDAQDVVTNAADELIFEAETLFADERANGLPYLPWALQREIDSCRVGRSDYEVRSLAQRLLNACRSAAEARAQREAA